jgi:hypothetical protein
VEVILNEIVASGAISKACERIVGSLEKVIQTYQRDALPWPNAILTN